MSGYALYIYKEDIDLIFFLENVSVYNRESCKQIRV